MDIQGNVRADFAQRLPDTVAGNAAADRVDPRSKCEQLVANTVCDEFIQRPLHNVSVAHRPVHFAAHGCVNGVPASYRALAGSL